MERNDKNRSQPPEKLHKNQVDQHRKYGLDPATTNNEPFDEGQLETEHKPPVVPINEEGESEAGNDVEG